MFEELKEKYQTEKDAEIEIDMFKGRQEKDDSNFIIYFKWAESDATKLKRGLIKACRELEKVCSRGEGLNRSILCNIMFYSRAKDNTKELYDKLPELKDQSSERGVICSPQTSY